MDVGGTDPPLSGKVLRSVARTLGKDWRELGTELGLEDPELDSIEVQYISSGLKETSYQTLRTWRDTTLENVDLSTLLKHLENIERKDIVKRISRTVAYDDSSTKEGRCTDSDLLALVRDRLMDAYLKLTMKALPWMPDLRLRFDQYYVDLTLTKLDEPSLTPNAISLQDVFTPVDETKKLSKILVEGGPGMGKSTLAAKLAYDWAQEQDYMKHFDLVVLFPLSDIVGDLKEATCEATHIKEQDYEQMFRIFKDKSKQILFIMDGFDEISQNTETMIRPILQPGEYSHITVIVTCRLGKFTTNKESVDQTRRYNSAGFALKSGHFIQKHINVAGFSSDGKNMFVDNYTQLYSKEKKQQLTCKLNTMVAKDFLKCPLFLLVFVVTFTENLCLKSKTELYKQVFNCIIRRYFSKLSHRAVPEIDLFSDQGTTKCEYIKAFEQLSTFSLWAIRSHHVSFTNDEVVKNARCNPWILDLDIFTQCVTMRLHEKLVYEPVHKSLLEFAAACSIWLAFVQGSHTNKQWKRDVISLRPDKDTSLCFTFLMGLMDEKADIILNVLMFCDWHVSLKFKNWYPVVLEMNVSESVLTSMSSFLPQVWRIGWDGVFGALAVSHQHKAVVRWGTREKRIKQIDWDIRYDILIPPGVVVDTLIIRVFEDFGSNTSKQLSIAKQLANIRCKNLWCNFYVENCRQSDVFKYMLNVANFKQLSFALKRNRLSDIDHVLTDGKLRNTKLHWIKVNLDVGEAQQLGKLIPLINSKAVTGLGFEATAINQLNAFNNLINVLGSSELISFTLQIKVDPFAVDVGELCNGGQKSWEWVQLEGINIDCTLETDKQLSIKCLELQLSNFVEGKTMFIQHCSVKSLSCTASLIAGCEATWPLCNTLTELNVVIDGTLIQKGFSMLLPTIRNLQVLGLIVMPNCSLACPTEEWLLGLQNYLRLKGIELWGAVENRTLITTLVTGIAQGLQAVISDDESLSASLPVANSHNTKIQLQYLMITNSRSKFISYGESDFLLDIARILKEPLATKCLQRLEIVHSQFAGLPLNSWLDEFPYDEGFRVCCDIWGCRKDDTIKSKMMNDRDPGSVERISVASIKDTENM